MNDLHASSPASRAVKTSSFADGSPPTAAGRPPLVIGDIEVLHPIVLAPMAAITDVTYRSICRTMGAGLCVTEAAYAHRLLDDDAFTWQLTEADGDRGDPLLTQLYGNDPTTMAEAARRLERRGAQGIDINCGCPMPKIVKKGIGAALLRDPPQIARVVEAMREAVTLPITVKIRAGWESSDVATIGRHIESAGGAAITIHGRTRHARYGHHADLDAIAELKQRVDIPVIGNGDVCDRRSAESMFARTGCDAVMVGRAAIGNPWVFRDIRAWLDGEVRLPPATAVERGVLIHEHLERSWRRYGGRVVREFRKHLLAYVRETGAEQHVRRKLRAMDSIDVLRTLIDEAVVLMGEERAVAGLRPHEPNPHRLCR